VIVFSPYSFTTATGDGKSPAQIRRDFDKKNLKWPQLRGMSPRMATDAKRI
jgi:hypothetical protein